MENKNLEKEGVSEQQRIIDEHIRTIVSKAVDESKVLQEINKNRISVGSGGFDSIQEVFWQPHHLRAYFDFDRTSFDASKPTLKFGLKFGFRFVNSKEFEVSNFHGCRIVVKKSQIEITNKIEHKRFYVVRLDSTCRDFMIDVCARKVKECLAVLREFIKIFGGSSNFRLISFRSQDKISREESIDRIPVKMQFDSQLVQKVYNEPNVEFKDAASAVTYLENRALERVSPEIKERLDLINKRIDLFEEKVIKPWMEQISIHLPVERKAAQALTEDVEIRKEMLKTLKDIQKGFSQGYYPQRLEHYSSNFGRNRELPPLPITISKYDSDKVRRLKLAYYYLDVFGWGHSVWGGD